MKRLIWLATVVGGGIALLRAMGWDITLGGLVLGPKDIQRMREQGANRPRIVMGGCVIGRDVEPAMVVEVMPRLVVIGGFVADRAIADAYAERLISIGGASYREPRTVEGSAGA